MPTSNVTAIRITQFEKVVNIDEGDAEDGYGVQLTIVWDGELGDAVTQTVKPPKRPVKNVEVEQGKAKKAKIRSIVQAKAKAADEEAMLEEQIAIEQEQEQVIEVETEG